MRVHDLTGLLLKRYSEATLKRFFNITSPWVEVHFSYITFDKSDETYFQLEVGNISGVLRFALPECIKGTPEECVPQIVDWVAKFGIWNLSETRSELQKMQVNAQTPNHKDGLVVLEAYAESSFVRTRVSADFMATLPRGPAFSENTFSDRSIGQILDDPEVKYFNDYFQGKSPIRSWVRTSKLDTMIITRLEYVYELGESLFMSVVLDHARTLLPKAELIALFSRTNIKGIY